MSITAAVRSRDIKIFAHIVEFGRQSLRQIAQATGQSKDQVARSLTVLGRRDQFPESPLWETEAGQAWLHRLVLATVYEFGLKGNQGADRMAEFLKRIRVDSQLGISPSALRTLMGRMEAELVEFQQQQEQQQRSQGGAERDIIASGDETWLGDQLVLVLLELSSGYLLLEEAAADRSYETWAARAQVRVTQLGLRVRHFISDRGKSLIKLATASLGCGAGADLFHAQYGISKWLGCALHGKVGRACKRLKEAEAKLASLKAKEREPEKMTAQAQRVQQCQEELRGIEADQQAYSETQRSISAAVHAFSLADNTPQCSAQVEGRLQEQAHRFEQIAKEQALSDKKDAAGKFKRQIKDVASTVDAWWLWTHESLGELRPTPQVRNWLLSSLLPVIYWDQQVHKTQNPDMKKLDETAWRKAQAAYETHPVTLTISKQEVDRWRSWAEWACGNFHRASSAVEGRNGCLSQSYHNGRGLTRNRLAALTAIHNYDTRWDDGSTPAQRLFKEPFPDLFEWLIGQMDALPLPRKARQRIVHNPLIVVAVAA
jgi:Family of unknown function (DUF6399)